MREPRQIVGPRHAHPPNGDRACRRLAVTIIRRLQSFTQWWVRLNKLHTQKFGHFPKHVWVSAGGSRSTTTSGRTRRWIIGHHVLFSKTPPVIMWITLPL